MSHDAEFNALLDTLLNSQSGTDRAKAAQALGNYVEELDTGEYEEAKAALNRALTDYDPMVLTAAMQALTLYNRHGPPHIEGDDFEIHGDSEDDMIHPERALCDVCGRPEALIPQGGCERDDCPYK